jgi:ribosomal protein S18 acetylase RimI-like enzyme
MRQFGKADTESIINLANKYAYFDGPISEKDLEITYSFPEAFIIAEQDSNIIGFVYGYFRDVPIEVLKNWGVVKVATIELLVVDPRYRKHGVGTELLDRVVRVLRDAGAELIGLHCPEGAIEARRLYEKMGFEVSAYHMRKKLI